MPFSSLTGAQQIMVRLYMTGGPKYRAEMERAGLVTRQFAGSVGAADVAMAKATKRSFMLNQGLFMARRGLFYATLGIVGMTAAVAKLGFDYLNTMQQARVGLGGFIKDQGLLNKQLRYMYVMAARTPFEFQDIILATRRLNAFTGDLQETNRLILSITNGLSAAGILTGAALQRATLALSHMYSIGHLTGQTLLQLNRDNIQMTKALMYYYHASGEEIKESVSAGLISATDAAKAFNAYMQTPGFKGAAFAQATNTLYGAFTTFKDLIAVGAGGAEGGIFGGLTRTLQNVDKAILPLVTGGRPVTLDKIAQAIDKTLTPKSHLILNFFTTLEWSLKTVIGLFYALATAISFLLLPFNLLFGLFGANVVAAKLLGIALGVIITGFLIHRGVTLAAALATDAYKVALYGLKGMIWANVIAQRAWNIAITQGLGIRGLTEAVNKWAFAQTVRPGSLNMSDTINANNSAMAKFTRTIFNAGDAIKGAFKAEDAGAFRTAVTDIVTQFKTGGFKAGLKAMVTGLQTAAAAAWSMTAAALTNPWTWIALAVVAIVYALIVLYFRWERFHNLVNRTANWVKEHWYYLTLIIGIIFPIIPVVATIVRHWRTIRDYIKSAYEWAKKLYDILKNPIKIGPRWLRYSGVDLARDIGKVAKYASPTGSYYGGGHQMGGLVPGGFSLVGERGPELVQIPGGSRITPNANVNPIGWSMGGVGGNGNERPIVVNLVVDRKVLATAVARANQDYAARR